MIAVASWSWRSANKVTVLAVVGVLALGIGAVAVVAPGGSAWASPLNDCAHSDNGDPVLTSVDLSPVTVDVTGGSARLTVTASAEDTGGPGPATGLRRFTVAVADPTDEYNVVRMSRTPSGDWVGSLTVRKWARAGTWDIAQVYMEDRLGQFAIYNRTGEEEKDLSLVAGVHAISVTSVVDRTPPELKSFDLSRTSLDTSRHNFVKVSARIRDDQTGVAVAGAWLVSPRGGRTRDVLLHQVPGTAHEYRGRLSLGRWLPSGTWKVRGVVAANPGNRYAFFGYRALGRLGFSRDLQVISGRDPAAPTISLFRSPDTVDVRVQDQRVAVTAQAHDLGSGVRKVTASFSGPHMEPVEVDLRLVSGTRRDGVWRGSTTIATCTAATAVWGSDVYVMDLAGRTSFYWSGEPTAEGWPGKLRVTGRPHVAPPRARVTQHVPPDGRVAVTFDRAVNGISATSATVRRWSPDSPAPPGPVLAGRWTCRDVDAAITSCATGRVRWAGFKPATALQAGRWHTVVLNPEHSLEVTDRGGNPYDRDMLLFQVTR